MTNITIRKDLYDYHFQQMHSIIRRKLNRIEILYYWISNRKNIHHIFLRNGSKTQRINITLGKNFRMPGLTNLWNNSNWSVTLPEEYDASYLIYELVFRQNGGKKYKPVSTLIGISPEADRRQHIEFRKKVKRLALCLTYEVQTGILTYDTAASHFSATTGLRIEHARRYFCRFLPYS
ncbi:TPA: hypothetical protein O7X85_002470 [Salmonella enterica]|nr:hypothetical protein [Salmonella enterica]